MFVIVLKTPLHRFELGKNSCQLLKQIRTILTEASIMESLFLVKLQVAAFATIVKNNSIAYIFLAILGITSKFLI